MTEVFAPGSRLGLFVPRLVRHWLRDVGDHDTVSLIGSLLVADISGFTAIVQRLEKAIEAGSEEVSGVLEVCFADLIGDAESLGGDVLFTAGDSINILFLGEQHETRACMAADARQARVRSYHTFSTRGGSIKIAMSAGVASGELTALVIGTGPRVLVVTGPVTREAASLQHAAPRGSVFVSPATARALPTHAAESRGAVWSLRAMPLDLLVAASKVLPPDSEFSRSFVPPDLHDRINQEAPGEYRPIWWEFLRVTGTFDPGAAASNAARLSDVGGAVLRAASEFGVTALGADFDRDGVRFMLAAGWPRGGPDSAERLLWAAHRIRDGLPPDALRIAISDGRVYAGEVGTPTRRVYSIVGGPVNVAARLLSLAEPGQIVATRSTIDATRLRPNAQALEPVRLRGLRGSQKASVIVGPRAPAGTDSANPRFVGRNGPLRALQASLLGPESALVEICGAPGVGKSRLLAEFLGAANKVVYLSECLPYERSQAYASFRKLCRDVLGIPQDADPVRSGQLLQDALGEDPVLAPWLPFVATVVNASVAETEQSSAVVTSFRQQKLRETVLTLIERRAASPAIVCFEDAHWMDDASSELLDYLLERADGYSWSFCVTRRPEPTGWRLDAQKLRISCNSLTLTSLARAEALELARAMSEQRPLRHETLSAIAEQSGGNPLFILKLVEAATSTGFLPRDLPADIESITSTLIDQLSSVDRQLLRDASVFGLRFDLETLQSVLSRLSYAGQSIVRQWIPPQECVRLVAPNSYEFRHALIRDAAYEGLSRRRRRALHATIGEMIEGDRGSAADQLDALVIHFNEAGDFERSWRYARQAGEMALLKDAPTDAAKYFNLALGAVTPRSGVADHELLGVLEKLSDALMRAGRHDTASKELKKALQLSGTDEVTRARLLRKLGETHEFRAEWDGALAVYDSALEILPEASHEPRVLIQRAQLCISYAGVCHRQGRPKECIDWATRAVALAAAGESVSTTVHAYCLLHLIFTFLAPAEAERYREQMLALVEGLSDPVLAARVFNNVGYELHYVKGHWDEGLGFYRRSLEIRDRIGDTVGKAMVGNNIAEVLLDQGRFKDAESMFGESLWAARAAGYRLGIALMRRNLGVLSLRQFRLVDAFPLLTEALAELGALGADERNILATRSRLAEYYVAAGNLPAARAEISAVRALLQPENRYPGAESDLLRLDARIALALGDVQAAKEALGQSAEAAREEALPFEEGLSLRELSRVADPGGVLNARASDIFVKLGVVELPVIP